MYAPDLRRPVAVATVTPILVAAFALYSFFPTVPPIPPVTPERLRWRAGEQGKRQNRS